DGRRSAQQLLRPAGAGRQRATLLGTQTTQTHSIELNPLSQRQVAAEVDGRGLPPHVRLPRIRSRLAAAAGLLLPAEGAADLRPAGPRVDVGDAAVRSFGGEEALGGA